jgi:glycerol-3-phosphate acyltransferase PlsX
VRAVPIALDAFGGDHCPRAEVEGALIAAREGHAIVLVGDRAPLEGILGQLGASPELPLRVHHAADAITMEDSPAKAVRQKPDASMPVCFDLVKRGEATAVVSAGNSGAMLACGLFKFGRIKGVERPAICTRLPNENGYFQLLDAGANIECRPVHLGQFAVMGAVYHAIVSGIARPRVGVLSNGTEEGKGTDLTRAVDRVLRQTSDPSFQYVGYVEGSIFRGACDVAVADGFTGNIALKIAEAAGALLVTILRQEVGKSLRVKLGGALMKPAFARARRESHPDHYGGAPLLGVKELAIICHGSSSPRTIATAIGQAAHLVQKSLGPALAAAVAAAEPLFEAARAVEAQEPANP